MAVNLFEKAIAIQRIIGIEIIDNGQRIPFNAVLVEQVYALHHLSEGRLSRGRFPVFVVELLWSVNGNTHQEIVFFEETAPRIVE